MSPQIELDSFVRWNKENIDRIARLYQEIEEIQAQFNGLYSERLAEWQENVESLSDRLLAGSAIPEVVATGLDENSNRERIKLETRVRELKTELAAKQSAANASLREAQAELARLRDLNPALDAREEKLKAQSLQETEGIAGLEGELRSVGFIQRLVAQSDLKQKLKAARLAHEQTLTGLRSVREEWTKKKEQVEAHQVELRGQWQQSMTAISEMQTELDYLTQNLANLSRRRGAQAYLASLPASISVSGDLGKELAAIGAQNETLDAYRSGLASVAEALGLLTGVKSGLERFDESASKVHEEQTRYNLKRLELDVPKSAVQFHNTWTEFQKRVRNEKYLGSHPLEFVDVVKEYVGERLTDQTIRAMFENMGHALSEATKAWD